MLTPSSQRDRIIPCVVAALLFFLIAAISARLAFSTKGQPFAGLLLDPYGSFSAVRFPTWPEVDGLRSPDRLLAIEGRPVDRPRGAPNQIVLPAIHRSVEARHEAGGRSLTLTFQRGHGALSVVRPLGVLGVDEIAFFFGFYTLIGAVILASGVIVYLIAERRGAARAYGVWAAGTALFLVTFYDYHTTARLVPLFVIGAMSTSASFLWLAWAFPTPPPGRRLSSLATLGTTLFTLFAVILCVSPMLPFDATALRGVVGPVSVSSLFVLMGVLIARWRRAEGEERAQLGSVVTGLATISALLGAGFSLAISTGSATIHLFLPVLVPLIPLVIAYSIVKHDLLHTDVLLRRRLLAFPLGAAALAVGLLTWLAIRYAQARREMDTLIPVIFSLPAIALVILAGYRVAIHTLFRAAAQYRPTMDDLSAAIGTLRDAPAIKAKLVPLVMRWLPAERAEMLLTDELPSLPPKTHADLANGQHVYVADGPRRSDLLVPLRFGNELCAAFRIRPLDAGALFTSEDLALLDTMAAIGGLALHNVAVLAEVERRRLAEARASREDKTRVLDTLSYEIAHELGHPLRYFKALFDDRTGAPFSGEELEIARHEVDRMSRMVTTLTSLEIPPPRKDRIALKKPMDHALLLQRERMDVMRIDVSVDVPDALMVAAEHDPLVQVFANLLRNAVEAAGDGGRVGVVVSDRDDGLAVDVWDDGPGVADEVRANLFRVWGITTRHAGKGFGLMVVNRILQHLHWKIDFLRDAGRTIFRITIPREDVLAS